MRIKDHTDTIRHLTDSFNIPEARRMIAENPALTQEQFKAGGIVEPGVTHYATYEKRIKKIKVGNKIYNFTGIKPHQVASVEDGLKLINKWKKNPTLENWVNTFRAPSRTGQTHQSDFSKNLRKYFQGAEIPKQTQEIFDTIKIKKIIGQKNANQIRTYTTKAGNVLKATKAGIIGGQTVKEGSMVHINAIRDAFVWYPDSGVEDLAKFIYGDDFTKANPKQKLKIVNDISNDVPKFLEALNGARRVDNFKMPNSDDALDIIDNIQNNKSGFKFQEGTLRNYKFNIRDAELMLPEGTSVADRGRLLNLKKGMGLALDETGTLSGTYQRAPGYTSGSQLIDNLLNKKKRKLIDKDFSNVLRAMVDGDPNATYQWRKQEVTRDELVKNYNEHANKFKKKYKIDAPTIELGVNPKKAVSNYGLYSKAEQANMQNIFKTKKFSIGFGKETLPLSTVTSQMKTLTDLQKQAKFSKPVFKKIVQSLGSMGEDISKWDTPTLVIFGKKMGCIKKFEGGNIATCLKKKLQTQPEKFAEVSSALSGSKNAKTAKNSFNLARKLMTVSKFTGWGLVGEAVFAPLVALPMWAKGTPKDEIIDMLTYGAFGQGREEKIQEKLSPLGRAYAKTQELNERGQALSNQLTTASEQGYERSRIEHDLRELEKEYEQAASIFTPDPITGDYNQELINKGAQDVEDVTKYFEDITSEGQKERAAWLAPKTSKVMETIIDKPGKAFIDFTLGPNWKENLPEQQNQFYKKRYPRNPRELGQHLSYDPDIPMFVEGGIVGLLKK
jgi:hypothetical protein